MAGKTWDDVKHRQLGLANRIVTSYSNMDFYIIGRLRVDNDIADNIACQNDTISDIDK